MSKYIDADRLRVKIEKERKKALDSTKRGGLTISDIATADVLAEVLLIIEQLKKEQPEVDLDSEIEEYWIAAEWSKVITLGKFKVIARYFYGLGQRNSK